MGAITNHESDTQVVELRRDDDVESNKPSIGPHAVEASTNAATTLDTDYEAQIIRHRRQGGFFTFAFLPLYIFGFLAGWNHLLTYLQTKSWFRNAAALAFGYDDTKEQETKTTSLVIDIHAILGISVVFALVVQVGTAIRLNQAKGNAPNVTALHKMGGRIIAGVWTITALLGATFTVVSKRHQSEDTIARLFVFAIYWSCGFGTLANMFLGISAIRNNQGHNKLTNEDKSLNRVRHKGLMFFSFFWVIGSSFDECLMSFGQAVVRDCYIDYFGGFLCASIGQTLQVSAIVLGAYTFEKTLFEFTFMKVNLALLGFRAFLLWSSIVFMLSTEMTNGESEESCFA